MHSHVTLLASNVSEKEDSARTMHDTKPCVFGHASQVFGRPSSSMSQFSEMDSGFDDLRASSNTPSFLVPNLSPVEATVRDGEKVSMVEERNKGAGMYCN